MLHRWLYRYAVLTQSTNLVRESLRRAAWATMPVLLIAYALGVSPLWALVPYAGTIAWWLLVTLVFRLDRKRIQRAGKAGRHGRV